MRLTDTAALPRLMLTVAGLLLLSACARDEPVLSDDATPPPVREAVWNRCTNAEVGYTIDYPQEWHTGDDGLACRVFDPEPIDLREEPERVPRDLGVIIGLEPVALEDFTAEDTGVEVTSTEDVEVDLHLAVRQELVATDQGPYPEGTELTRYAVDRNGETLVAATLDVGETPYERKVEVLDEMMSELEFASGP